jgi:hypothetical protein
MFDYARRICAQKRSRSSGQRTGTFLRMYQASRKWIESFYAIHPHDPSKIFASVWSGPEPRRPRGVRGGYTARTTDYRTRGV